jgi:hypothetical protein
VLGQHLAALDQVTFISATMPPSNDWITCSRELGITLPVPVETSVTSNQAAQARNAASISAHTVMTRPARSTAWSSWPSR